MEVIYKTLEEIRPYMNNPRKIAKAVPIVAESIRQFGFRRPIIIDKDGVIVCGHVRWMAAKKLKLREVPTICPDLTEAQAATYRLIDNRVGELTTWDAKGLSEELKDLVPDFDMQLFGFTMDDMRQEDTISDEKTQNVLAAGRLQVVLPPSSVIEAGDEYNVIYDYYKHLGIVSSEGRDNALLGEGKKKLAENNNITSLNGTSIFNPVLCHCLYSWFNREGGLVFDPFAGGYTRGCIACLNGYKYLGIELRQEQVAANVSKSKHLGISPTYICDDALNADSHIKDEAADMVLTCPPYYNLEVYSDDPQDLSNMNPEDFIDTYKKILEISYRKLKNNSFFVIVVSEVRDKKGYYRRFVLDTIDICKSLGLNYWDEIILVNNAATTMVWAGSSFAVNRKIASVHQNALVFYKGDPQKIATYWGKEAI